MSQRHWRSSLNNLNNERDLFNSLSLSGRSLSIKAFRKNPKNFLKTPWQNQKGVIYYKRRQERARAGHTEPCIVPLTGGFSFPIGPSRRVCLLIFTSFLWRRVGGAPDCWMVFIAISFLTTGMDPWRRGENTHTLTKRSDAWLWTDTGSSEIDEYPFYPARPRRFEDTPYKRTHDFRPIGAGPAANDRDAYNSGYPG